jgi:hypothetical protein
MDYFVHDSDDSGTDLRIPLTPTLSRVGERGHWETARALPSAMTPYHLMIVGRSRLRLKALEGKCFDHSNLGHLFRISVFGFRIQQFGFLLTKLF